MAYISFKSTDVRVHRIHHLIFAAIAEAAKVWEDEGVTLVVTSLHDGEHRFGSLHYQGRAVDLRTHNLPNDERRAVAAGRLRAALDGRYRVLHESIGTPNEHVHVEVYP